MSDLPAHVTEAGLLFQRPTVLNDAAAMEKIVDWGHQQIDVFYPEDPIRAPLNIVRRKLAHMEWNRVIRTQGRELRGMIASSMVQELEFQIQRRQQNLQAQDAETFRRQAVAFDSQQRVREQGALNGIAMRVYETQARLDHELSEKAADAASRRRKKERVAETEHEIAVLVATAIARSMGAASAEKTLEATRLVNDEIARIRKDKELTEDDKHLQIKVLLETLPTLLRGLRSSDV